MNDSWSRLALVLAVTLCSGCAVGQYHRGYHVVGDRVVGWGAVGREFVEPLAPFEEACVSDVLGYRLEALRTRFAPRLAAMVSDERLRELGQQVRDAYRFDGTFERLQAVLDTRMLDEGVGKDAFKFYDLVGTTFALGGERGATLTLLISKLEGRPRLVGFEIGDRNRAGSVPPLALFIAPESDDNAGLRGRHVKAVP